MAINPETQYPGKIAPATPEYPYGGARNITTPGDGTGTPWDAALVNDIFGFQQALLGRANSVPSGTPDKVGASQYLDALQNVTVARVAISSDILTADFSGVDGVFSDDYDLAGDGLSARWISTGVNTPSKAGTREGWRDAVFDSEGNEFKASTKIAFILLWMGQSNADGATQLGAGDQTIEDNIFTFSLGPTPARGWQTAAFGQNPLPSTGSNNAGIHFANEIKRRTGRPVYMMLNALGGQSLNEWVGAGTSSPMWVELEGILTDANLNSQSIDAVGWMQGEADGDDQATPYNTYATYKGGINTLFTQLQALVEWGQNTQFIASGVGEWNDQPNPERNDVNQTLNNDDDFPWAGNVYTTGLTRNPTAGNESHFDGDSLVTLGLTMAEFYLTGNVPDQKIGPDEQNGPYVYGTFGTGVSATLDRTFLKNDCIVICNDAEITWPDKPKVWDGAITTFDITDTSLGRTRLIGPFSYKGFDYTGPMDLNRIGQWRFLSSQGKVKLIEKPKGGSNTALSFQNGTFTPLQWELENETFATVNATVQLPEPTTTDGAQDLTGVECTFFAFSITGGSTFLTIDGGATGKFIDKTGTIVNQLEINVARGMIKLQMIFGFWVVISQNF